MLLYIPWFRAQALELTTPWGPLGVHPFGLLVLSGVMLGAWLARRQAQQEGLHPETVMNLAGWVLIPAFIVAHLFDALAYHPARVLEDPAFLLRIWEGISSFGGFLGAVLGALAWSRRRGVDLVTFADPIAFGFPLGWLFGRTGCFVTHDHPGHVTMFFLGVQDYEVGHPPYQVRHDLGLYEALWSAATVALFAVLARKRRPRGLYLALLPLLYAPARFALDFLRATDFELADARYLGLTPGHYSSLVLAALGGLVAHRVVRHPWPPVPRWAQWPEPGPDTLPGHGGEDDDEPAAAPRSGDAASME